MNVYECVDLNEAAAGSPDSVVAVDFDGVITDPHGMKAEGFAAAGYDISPAETSREYCVNEGQISEKVYEQIIRTVYTDRIDEIPLRTGAKAGLKKLNAAGFNPVVVTSRDDEEAASIVEYIDRHGLAVYGYINTGRGPKREPVADLGARAFIDDSKQKLTPFLESRTCPTDIYYFRNQGNRRVKSTDNGSIEAVGCWSKFVEEVVKSNESR